MTPIRECFLSPDNAGVNRKTMNIPPLKYCLGFPVLTALFSVCFLTVSGLATSLPPTQAVRWETDLNVAMARAEQEQRPLFLHFVGNDSQSAQQMGTEVFAHPNIASRLYANFVMVRINAVENPALAQRFSVSAIPTDIVLKPNGQLIHRRVGVITADRFSEYLVFLQNTIQPEPNQTPAPPVADSMPPVNPSGFPPPAPLAQPTAMTPGTPPTGTLPSGTLPPGAMLPTAAATHPAAMPPQQPALNGAIRDPFAQPSPGTQYPPVAAGGMMPPTSANNPLRTPETSARPALEPNIGVTNTLAPPVAAAMQAVAEEPAPTKMTVEVPLALEGFCPVMLCTEERWVSGNPAYCTMYQGHIFRFSSLEALVTFARNPANYTPVAMGEDVVLRVDRNRRVNGDRRYGAWFQGRVFLFSSQETFSAFESRPDYYAEIALKYETARRDQPVPIVY